LLCGQGEPTFYLCPLNDRFSGYFPRSYPSRVQTRLRSAGVFPFSLFSFFSFFAGTDSVAVRDKARDRRRGLPRRIRSAYGGKKKKKKM